MQLILVEIRSSFPTLPHLPVPAWRPPVILALAVLLGLALARLPLPLAAVLVVAPAALLIILIQPLAGLALTLLAGPLGALEAVTLGPALLNSGQLLLLLTLAAWLARSLLQRRLPLSRTALNAPLVLFIAVATLSLMRAPSLELGLIEAVKWLQIGAVMLLVAGSATRRRGHAAGGPVTRRAQSHTRPLVAMLLLAGLSQALIGSWQFGLRGDGPEHFLVLGRFYRAYGTFEQPNPFGGFMNLTALLGTGTLLGLVAAYRQDARAGRKERARPAGSGHAPGPIPASLTWLLLVLLCTAATTIGLLFSWSRGAWLGFAAAAAVLLLFWPRQRRHGLLLLLAAGLAFWAALQTGIAPAGVSRRLSGFAQDLRFGDVRGVDINDANYAVLERLAHWQAALAMAGDYPWLGVGFGNYEPAYPDYALVNWPFPLGHAHNYYLNILAEAGFLGLAAYGFFWAAVFRQTVAVLRRLDWPQRGVALGLLAAWTALSVHHLVDKLYVNNVYIHLGAMLGLLQLLDKQAQDLEMEC